MVIFRKPISISLSPNTEKDDVLLAFGLLYKPWKWNIWKKGLAIKELENKFQKMFAAEAAFSFNSGRSSLLALLQAYEFETGSEILIQAFTCNAVSNPIIWSGLEPVYCDIDPETFNIDPIEIEKKITTKTRAVIVQHTFGFPANLPKIQEICQKNNLVLIEDCAHSLGAEFQGKLLGTFGDSAFFSFGRDKIISSVYGGLAITKNAQIAQKLAEIQKNFEYPSLFWIKQQLLHPVLLNWLILPVYNFLDLGKLFLILTQIFHILSKAVHWKEKQGKIPSYFPKKMPNAMAILALNQFKKLDRFQSHRQKLAEFYANSLANSGFQIPQNSSPEFCRINNIKNSFLRFTLKIPCTHTLVHECAGDLIFDAWHKENILIGDWYTTPVAPFDTILEAVKYIPSSCPHAEKLCQEVLNLPTHINISQKNAERIVKFLKQKKIG